MVALMLTSDDMVALLRIECKNHGGVGNWAKAHGIIKGRSNVYEMLRGTRKISSDVAHKLGYRQRIVFEKMDEPVMKIPYCDLPGRGY